jgi:hypothetical protein
MAVRVNELTKARVQTRRRTVFATAMTTLVLFGGMATAIATGCIFDEGGYQGGGRRTGAPTATEDEPAPTSTSTSTSTSTGTSTSTSTATPDSGSPLPDTGTTD